MSTRMFLWFLVKCRKLFWLRCCCLQTSNANHRVCLFSDSSACKESTGKESTMQLHKNWCLASTVFWALQVVLVVVLLNDMYYCMASPWWNLLKQKPLHRYTWGVVFLGKILSKNLHFFADISRSVSDSSPLTTFWSVKLKNASSLLPSLFPMTEIMRSQMSSSAIFITKMYKSFFICLFKNYLGYSISVVLSEVSRNKSTQRKAKYCTLQPLLHLVHVCTLCVNFC